MNTNQLKRFSTEARNKLKAGIAAKISTLGFDAKGMVSDTMRPRLMEGGAVWNGSLQTEAFYHQWMSLYECVQRKGISHVYEEAAYTWFNRLVAIRILQKNGLADPVMEYADSARTPRIVDQARQGAFPQMTEQMRSRLVELLDDDTKVTEQFALLISAWCHQNPIISACFGGIADYTELLLPANILAEGQFVDMLNHTEFITDDDYRSPELIGWLYQFYISERKDEVFAKKGKFVADEIPAATQIFTPNWIVKYMVQNTVGRIYLDNNPRAAAEFSPRWKYLVELSAPTPPEAVYRYGELTDLLVGDLACGSGHILNECFDLLYDLYIYEGYSRREAIENIFKCNLRGVDLDTRAKQLATFALLLKASQKDASFADAHMLPMVLDMPKPIPQEEVAGRLKEFFCETPSKQIGEELTAVFKLMQDADSLGSIMKFNLSNSTLFAIRQATDYWRSQNLVSEQVGNILLAMNLMLTLTDKYAALVMNPPYMKAANMNEALLEYVKMHYIEGKHDMFAVFMLMGMGCLNSNGKMAQINMQSWMFITRYEKLRKVLINSYHIDSMAHLGANTFDEMPGDVLQNTMFVISNTNDIVRNGRYFRLTGGENCNKKEKNFLAISNNLSSEDSFCIPQSIFLTIPEQPIIYHIGANMRNLIIKSRKLEDYAYARVGMFTGDNTRFLREWWEVMYSNFYHTCSSYKESVESEKKWYPYNKGGGKRRWYGNMELVVNYQHGGYEIYELAKEDGRNSQNYPNKYKFVENITWSTAGEDAFRLQPRGSLFDTKGMSMFIDDKSIFNYLMGLCNSTVGLSYLKMISPGIDTQVGQVRSIPTVISKSNDIDDRVANCLDISKLDWDSHETSWDFEANPLVALRDDAVADGNTESSFKLSALVELFETTWEERFHQLHENEEELNRQFIDIYGLQDELSPEVPMNEITILQQGEISIDNNQICWHDDVIIKQFISFIMGCYMGRYRLDRPELAIVYPDAKPEETAPYTYGDSTFAIDEDGIIPLMASDCGFSDNGAARVAEFVGMVLGTEKQTENLNYMEQCLGKTLEAYMMKDFWRDHKRMYQNRPIYWLFASKKGTFQCIAYMHRMSAYTAERVRAKYLLPFIEHLQNRINDLNGRAASLSTKENRQLTTLQKQLEECQEYHDRLQVIAEQAISFDLDDGVVVNYVKFGDVLAKIK